METIEELPKMVYINEGHGITEMSKDFCNTYLPLIGKVKKVIFIRSEFTMNKYTTIVIGAEAMIILDGFRTGIGEGAAGLRWLLVKTDWLKIFNESELQLKDQIIRCRKFEKVVFDFQNRFVDAQ